MIDEASTDLQRIRDVKLGERVRIMDFVNLYGCSIGDDTFIGPFVEIQTGASIGSKCKVQSHSFICTGTTIEDEVFVGHGVMFTNDRYPLSTTPQGAFQTQADWTLEGVTVKKRAAIGSAAVILPGIEIGEGALIGAGAVVTKNVGAGTIVAGNPARVVQGKSA